MKIYIVTDGCYSDYHIEAVFTDRKKAELYASLNNCQSVEMFHTHDNKIEGDLTSYYRYEFEAWHFHDMELRYTGGCYTTENGAKVEGNPKHLRVYVSLSGKRSYKKAKKIAQDLVAEWKAAWNEGRRDEHPKLVEYIKEIKEEGEEK